VDAAGAEQLVEYIAQTIAILGTVPTQRVIVAERFFDEAGGMQVVLHTPFGGGINRAWGMALRKRFCLTFDFELQAAATDDGIVLSLGEQHSFPLETLFAMVRPALLERDLVQAVLAAPMFGNRWRWNSTRALALLRYQGGKKVPIAIQRMRAEDLLAAVFPAQLACGDNHAGPIEPPDHPLVNETLANCLQEAMDLRGLRRVLQAIEGGEIRTVAIDTPVPSPMSHEILNANPYAFLDDAPLEERRARAVSLRRTDPDLAAGVGALDRAAIDEVRAQAWPDVRDAEELHDLLLSLGVVPVQEADRWGGFLAELVQAKRATVAHWRITGSEASGRAYVAAERLHLVRAALPSVCFDPLIDQPPVRRPSPEDLSQEFALGAIVQGWMECVGPTTGPGLAARLGLTPPQVDGALLRLEANGTVLRGHFTPGLPAETLEWCERRLLARIHRLTLGRLRREIEPVSVADFIRFLLRWQHVSPGTRLYGRDGVLEVIGQLQGLELPAPAWEQEILPARIARYSPDILEDLCLAGLISWGRLGIHRLLQAPDESVLPRAQERPRPRRPMPTRGAPLAFALRQDLPWLLEPAPCAHEDADGLSAPAREVLGVLARAGASFLTDLVHQTGRLAMEVEEALWELVACGLVTGDGMAGLRTLLLPDIKRLPPRHRAGGWRGVGIRARLMPVGRWALLRLGEAPGEGHGKQEGRDEAMARQLLRRYGVVVRELLARENAAPPWRILLHLYRRMEARGEIRGGRFVGGLVGEQFALPEAVEALRGVRRQRAGDER
jgi:ATP-dependent Lhr-like helicase